MALLREFTRRLLSLPFMIGGVVIVIAAAFVTIVASSTASLLILGVITCLFGLVGLQKAIAPLFGIVLVLGTLVPPIMVTVWLYRRLPHQLRDGLEPEIVRAPEEAGAVPRTSEPVHSLAELDARLAPTQPQAAPLVASQDPSFRVRADKDPARTTAPSSPGPGNPGEGAREFVSVLGGLLRRLAVVAGFGVGTVFAYAEAVIVGNGPLWLAELPLLLGAVGAAVIGVRSPSTLSVRIAEGFLGACILFGLLFLGAG